MSQSTNCAEEVMGAYDQYLRAFLRNDIDAINSMLTFPITYIAESEVMSLTEFPVQPSKLMEDKQWHTTIDLKKEVHGCNENKAHVIASGTRIRKDGSVIEYFSAFYAYTKTEDGWKMFALSDVVIEPSS